jgi:hypothetical protein
MALFLAGTPMGPTGAGAGGFGSGLFESMGENRLGMCRGPAVGQHLLQTQVIRMQAEQKVADVDPGLDPMTLDRRPAAAERWPHSVIEFPPEML